MSAEGNLEAAAGRLTPWARGLVDGGRRRINHEIDRGTDQLAAGIQVGVDARIAERTVASLAFGRNDYGFDPDEIFLGANLQELLNPGCSRPPSRGGRRSPPALARSSR